MASRNVDICGAKRMITNIFNSSKSEWDKIESRSPSFAEKKRKLIFNFRFHEYNDSLIINHLSKKKFEPQKEYKNHRIFLPPTEETDFLPLLTFEWDYDEDKKWMWKFVLDIIKTDELDTKDAYRKIFSLRFETHHGEGGTHSYPHVQINNRIFGPCESSYTLTWLPRHQPHILIRSDMNSNSPVILLIYLLSSLYGFKKMKSFIDGIHENYYKNDMKIYFSES